MNPDGPPGRVAQAAKEGRIGIVPSWDLMDELVTVLARQKLRRYRIAPEDERQILVLLGKALPSVEVAFPLRDPDDVAVAGAALVGRADAIVTGDRGLLEDAELRAWLGERGVEVLTPAELLARLG